MGLMTGILVAGLATKAAASVVAAKKAGNAAKDVTTIQTAASDAGRAEVTAAKGRSDALMDPYVRAGRVATASLGRLVTPSPAARFAAPDPGARPASQAPAPPPPMAGGRPRPPGAPTNGQAVPRSLGSLAPPPPQGGNGMVLLAANDGSGSRPVPASEASRFLQTGKFTRVG